MVVILDGAMGLSRHFSHQHLGQPGLHGLALGQALAQVGAQAAQGGDTGDDAGLFGEGRVRIFV